MTVFQSAYGLEEADCSEWQVLKGKPFNKIMCSKFCDNKILQKYYELCDNCGQNSDDQALENGSQVVKVITNKMCECEICQNGSNHEKLCVASQAHRCQSNNSESPSESELIGTSLVPTDTEPNTSSIMDHSGFQSSPYPTELSTDLVSQIVENTEEDIHLRIKVIGNTTPLSTHLENKFSDVCMSK